MASASGDVDHREHLPPSQAEKAAWTALAEYVVPPEIIFKEWYLSSSTSAQARIAARRAAFPNYGLLAGSRTEALFVPDVLVMPGAGNDGAFTNIRSDYDTMFPIPNRVRGGRDDDNDDADVMSGQPHSAAATQLVALESVAGDPRYYRLVPNPRLRDALRRRHPSYDGGYLPHRYFTVATEESSATKSVGVHGPAVYIVDYSSVPSTGETTVLLEQDLVDSIQLDAWPAAIADDWLHRLRPSGWPGERLTRDLVDSAPVFVTPTGLSGSSLAHEAFEWRLSFSLPERRLALSLTAAQRAAYVLVKLLMKAQAGAESDADGGGSGAASSFRTFYLKNALFWACEMEPADVWRRPADGARALLARIERFATNGRLPSFFVPASNLLNREPAEALLAAAARARRLRERPLDALRLIATSRHVFMSLGIVDYEPLWRWVDAEAAAAAAAAAAVEEAEEVTRAATPVSNTGLSSSLPRFGEASPIGGPSQFVSANEAALLALFAAHANLLKQIEASLPQQHGDSRKSVPVRIMHGAVRSVAGRLAVDIYCCKRRQHDLDDAIGSGRYVLSSEASSFEAFVRSLMVEHGVASDDLVLHSRALLRRRMRGGDELSSGSFAPVTERDLRLMEAQCALLLPSAIMGIMSGIKMSRA